MVKREFYVIKMHGTTMKNKGLCLTEIILLYYDALEHT